MARLRASKQSIRLQLQGGVLAATEPRPNGVGDLKVLKDCVIPVDYVCNNHFPHEISLTDSAILDFAELKDENGRAYWGLR